jgi:hypothetical protein
MQAGQEESKKLLGQVPCPVCGKGDQAYDSKHSNGDGPSFARRPEKGNGLRSADQASRYGLWNHEVYET